jgi:UDP-N-acetylmuramate dehydrogenase
MAEAKAAKELEEFAEFIRFEEPLSPYTYLKIGGPAEALVQPRSRAELGAVVKRCLSKQLPLRVLGGGCNLLVRDEGVRGAVLRLSEPAFAQVTVAGRRVRAGAGATVASLISSAARSALAGVESLVGTPGTVGGALRQSAGAGEIGQCVRLVETLDTNGNVQTREREELGFSDGWNNLDDPILLLAEFELEEDDVDAIVKRMRKAWIHRKGRQPFSYQAAGRIFKNPRGATAQTLIEQAGLAGTKVGGAEVSERDANYIVTHPEATARDVLRLIDLIRSKVREQFGIELELAISAW